MNWFQSVKQGAAERVGQVSRNPQASGHRSDEQFLNGTHDASLIRRSTDFLTLQHVVGNQAVQRLLQRTGGPSGATIQRVTAKLIDGLDVEKPGTYDTGGGHSYADHGAQTTEQQQRNRLKTGVAPSGRSSPVPSGAGASITGPMGLDAAGPIYYRDGTSAVGTTVQVDLTKVAGSDDTFRLNTMFPMP